MNLPRWRLPTGHFLSHVVSAVLAQAILSGSNFVVGLLLLRTAGTGPYAHFVLAANGMALMVSLQTAFLGPPLSTQLPGLSTSGRALLVGGLLEEQRHVLRYAGFLLAAVAALVALQGLWSCHAGRAPCRPQTAAIPLVALCSVFTLLATLRREFLRQTLLALRRAHDMLRADVFFAVVAMAGVLAILWVPTWTAPAAILLAMALGAAGSRKLLERALHRQLLPPVGRQPGLLAEMAPLALWSTSGAALFWLYTQGFLYMVAANLGVEAVAALAATRLLLMPVNLLSSGLGGLLAPAAARWLGSIGRAALVRRLGGIALAMGIVTALWVMALYDLHDSLLPLLFRHPIHDSRTLLLAWGGAYVSLALRDQLGYLLTALGRYRQLTTLTAVATLTSLVVCWLGMSWLHDVRGAILGIVAGELVSLAGTVTLVLRAARRNSALSPGETAFQA